MIHPIVLLHHFKDATEAREAITKLRLLDERKYLLEGRNALLAAKAINSYTATVLYSDSEYRQDYVQYVNLLTNYKGEQHESAISY